MAKPGGDGSSSYWILSLELDIARRRQKGERKKVIKRYSIFHFATATVMMKIEMEAQVAVAEINFHEIKK